MRKVFAGLILIAILASGFLLFCRSPPRETGSVLRSRLNGDIVSSDPGMKRDANTDAVLLHVAEGLVAVREDGSVGPMLASGWSRSRIL